MVVYFSMRLIFQLKLFTKHLLTHSPTRQLIKKNYIISEGLYRQTGSIFCSARRTRMGLTHFALLYSGVISPFYHKIVENNRRAGNNRMFPYIPYLPHPSPSNNLPQSSHSIFSSSHLPHTASPPSQVLVIPTPGEVTVEPVGFNVVD